MYFPVGLILMVSNKIPEFAKILYHRSIASHIAFLWWLDF
jgi:hypothetical protein